MLLFYTFGPSFLRVYVRQAKKIIIIHFYYCQDLVSPFCPHETNKFIAHLPQLYKYKLNIHVLIVHINNIKFFFILYSRTDDV